MQSVQGNTAPHRWRVRLAHERPFEGYPDPILGAVTPVLEPCWSHFKLTNPSKMTFDWGSKGPAWSGDPQLKQFLKGLSTFGETLKVRRSYQFPLKYWWISFWHLRPHRGVSHLLAARRIKQCHGLPMLMIGTVLNLRTTTSQKCAAVPRRAHI